MGINRAASTISSGGVRCPHQCAGKNICPSIYLLRNVQEAGKCFRVLKHPGDMSSRILTKWEEIQTIMRVHLFRFNKVKLFWFWVFPRLLVIMAQFVLCSLMTKITSFVWLPLNVITLVEQYRDNCDTKCKNNTKKSVLLKIMSDLD